jgi:hypothetical protein
MFMILFTDDLPSIEFSPFYNAGTPMTTALCAVFFSAGIVVALTT